MTFDWINMALSGIHHCNNRIGWLKMFLLLVILQLMLLDTAFAQGKPASRRWSVRKTGEFGRRLGGDNLQSGSASSISTRLLSQELELPTRQFRLSTGAATSRSSGSLEPAETRRYSIDAPAENSQFFRGAGDSPSHLEIRKPSLDLELPRFGGHRNFVADQEAQETEDNDVGYVYPKPEEGYNYEEPTPSPGIKPNEELEDQTTTAPDPPSPVEPDVVAGNPFVGFSPMKVETDENVDADSISNKKTAPPSSPQIQGIPSSEEHDKSACSGSDDDPACWPHGYGGVIPGTAGEDYPILSEIVKTDFSCDEQQFSGYYADADPQARCQIYHVCLKKNRYRETQQWSFLCPNGTMFSQPDFVCVWWGDAPECSDTMVRSLYNLNEQLGWDNITEGGGSRQSTNVGELQGAMSAFNAKAAAAATPSATRQSSALPYRVPVKVPEGNTGRARTKLQEVTQNGLHGQSHDLDYGEHDGEESSNFETSLRQQSESRTKTKSGSAFHKSISEGYELKGSADGVQPLIVNRPPPPSAPTDHPQYENQDVVMMPTLQRFPDGSEGYAEVPVMLPHHSSNPTTTQNPTHEEYREDADTEVGYQYPNPTSTPAPTYLPPRRSTTPPPTTTEYFPPPTIPTEPPILASAENENYEQSPERFATTEQPEEGYRYPQPTTTEPQPEDQDGYNYPNPNQSAQQQQQATQQDSEDGYRYPQPTTTERQPALEEQDTDEQGYRYPNPTTTQRSSRFRQPISTTTEVATESTTEEPYEEGYNYQVPTAGSQFESLRETTTEQQQEGYNYQRPNNPTTTENYNELIPTGQSADLVRDEDQVSTTPGVPTTTEVELPPGGYLPPRSNDLAKQQLQGDGTTTEEVDYEEDEEANEVVTDSAPAAGLAGEEDESGYSYNFPTPPSSSTSVNDIVLNGGALDSDEKLNEILKQIQSGGIEAVDSNGKPIEFSRLKELLLNSPRGSVELKGELDSVSSQSTEVSTTPFAEAGGKTVIPQQQTSAQPQQPSTPQQQPFYHTVTTAAILPNNPQNNNVFNTNSQRTAPAPTSGGTLSSSPNGFYLPPSNNNNAINNQPAFPPQQQQQQQQYYSNNENQIVQYVDHPSYEIKLPNREFETHSVDLNSIALDPNTQNRQFSQRQPQSGYYQTQSNQQSQVAPQQQQFFQQQSPPPGNYLPPPPPPQRQVQQPQPDYDRSNILNNLVLPTPQRQQQQQQQPLPSSRPNGEYLPPRQATSSILQPQYYQQPSSPSRPFVSQPIQLTENIQLQQSFALPTQQPLFPTNGKNPLVDPKDIKIVPALFVHQHTSVASQDDHGRGGNSLTGSGNIEDAFQNLDTAQSNYYTTATSGLTHQLSQLTNLTPQSSSYTTGPRQFFRRSNNNNGGSSSPSGSSNSGASAPSHIIEQAHQVSSFTLEDARTPEELQKYHHQDLKRFHKDNIANQGSILDDAPVPPTTHSSLPVIASIARQPQQATSGRNGRKEGSGSTTATRFSVSSANNGGGGSRSNSNRDINQSSHRNEEYFIPVSGSYGGGGGGSGSSPPSSSRTSSNNGSGGSIVRNSNRNTSNNDNNFSQFRVNGGHSSSSRGGGGGSSGPSSSYRFIDAERTLLSRFLPEREGGFGSRLYL